MKLLICSDIHGDLDAVKNLFQVFDKEKCDKMLILGDLLYHGPRNDLPEGYRPKEVIALLNSRKKDILSVRGNCDTEVDQTVLEFPVLADYAYIMADGICMIATHGHKFSPDSPPPMNPGEILLTGHTHIPDIYEFGNGNFYINPGSASLPKMNNPKTYIIFENSSFTLYDFDGNSIGEAQF